MKNYCDYDAFQMLSKKAISEPDDLQIIEDAVDSFTSYVKDIDVGEQQLTTAFATLDGEALRQRYETIDSRRRRYHNNAIMYVGVVNNLCNLYGVNAVFTGNADVRTEITEFCLQITTAIFENRRK